MPSKERPPCLDTVILSRPLRPATYDLCHFPSPTTPGSQPLCPAASHSILCRSAPLAVVHVATEWLRSRALRAASLGSARWPLTYGTRLFCQACIRVSGRSI